MSITHIITDLPPLKEENIIFSDEISYTTKKGITYKVLNGKSTCVMQVKNTIKRN